jgi:Ohr subfamily peroxiredoxin
MMPRLLYRAYARAIGGRQGFVRTDTETLKLDLAEPGSCKEKTESTTPEQLFACGLAASFSGALEEAGREIGMSIQDALVEVEITLQKNHGRKQLAAMLTLTLPGMSHAVAAQLAEKAYQRCPFACALKGNVPIRLRINNHILLRAA